MLVWHYVRILKKYDPTKPAKSSIQFNFDLYGFNFSQLAALNSNPIKLIYIRTIIKNLKLDKCLAIDGNNLMVNLERFKDKIIKERFSPLISLLKP